MVKIKMKHEKTKHELDVDVSLGVELLRAQIQSITGVPCDRQKIVIKGKELKDGDNLEAVIKPGLVAMLMGSAEAIPEKPTVETKFIEDVAGTEVVDMTPPGLKNLGNTCYMNATLQCFNNLPAFRKKLATLPPGPPSATEQGVMASMSGVFNELQKLGTGREVSPLVFVMMAREHWPQFNQMERGGHTQQDAEEFCGAVMQAGTCIKNTEGLDAVTELFEGQYEEVSKCVEAPEEPQTTNYSTFRIMRCNLDSDTATVESGLEKAMTFHREVNSPSLGRTAQYEVTSKLSKLPEYLWINIVRFEWRKEIQKKTKKLRKVVFPFKLDVYVLCSEKLKEEMKGPREELKAARDKEMEKKRKEKQEKMRGGGKEEEKKDEEKKDEEKKNEEKKDEEKKDEEKKDEEKKDEAKKDGDGDVEMSQEETKEEAPASPKREFGNNNAYYDLCGIVTHKGRDSESGHYIGWTKQKDGRWMCFDDHKVYEVSEDKIRELAGGGEADSAYLLCYRTRDDSGVSAGVW